MRLLGCLSFIVCVSVLMIFCGCRKAVPSAGQVVLYCSVDQAVAEPIIAEFEKQSGIKVLARFDTEASKTVGLVQKIRAEKDSPAADVFWSSEVFYTIRLAREGLLSPFDDQEFADWPSTFVDAGKLWHGLALRGRVIAYNTQKVAEAEAPTCLEDVLLAQWKGLVVMARPQFGTTGGDVASWVTQFGTEKTAELLELLKANEVRLVDGNSTAVRMVGSGQADVCFTDTDDVYAAQRNKWPVAMKMLRRGGQGTLTIPNTAAIVKGGPNPENAKVLMRFLLGGTAERMLLESDSHNWPVRKAAIKDIDKFKQYEIDEPLVIDYQNVADHLEASIQSAGEALN